MQIANSCKQGGNNSISSDTLSTLGGCSAFGSAAFIPFISHSSYFLPDSHVCSFVARKKICHGELKLKSREFCCFPEGGQEQRWNVGDSEAVFRRELWKMSGKLGPDVFPEFAFFLYIWRMQQEIVWVWRWCLAPASTCPLACWEFSCWAQSDISWTLYLEPGNEKLQKLSRATFVFSHVAPPDHFWETSGLQCRSGGILCVFSTLPSLLGLTQDAKEPIRIHHQAWK